MFGRGTATNMYRQLFLAILVLAGLWAAAKDRRPSKDSFMDMWEEKYGQAQAAEDSPGARTLWGMPLPFLRDRSMQANVTRSRYLGHGPIALATVTLKANFPQTEEPGAKQKKQQKRERAKQQKQQPQYKLYEHRYVGFFHRWFPLPYPPMYKADQYGVGLCVLGRCVCSPKGMLDPLLGARRAAKAASKKKASGAKKASDGNAEEEEQASGSPASAIECSRFQGSKSAVLNAMVIPNALLFILWQFPANWGRMSAHATLSMANLGKGRLWTLLAAPFSHRSWGEIFHSGVLLSNAIDSFDRAGISFTIFLLLYLCGSWTAWLARRVVWQRVCKNDSSAYWSQEWGASGGLAAQLLFLAKVRPTERFQFSLYLVPIPVNLSAWQSCFAQLAMDLAIVRGGWEQLVAYLAAWAFGWVLADAWLLHAAS